MVSVSRFQRAVRDAELLSEIAPHRLSNGARLFSRADLVKVRHRIELRTAGNIHTLRSQAQSA